MNRTFQEIAAIETQLRAGHPQVQGVGTGTGRLVGGISAAPERTDPR